MSFASYRNIVKTSSIIGGSTVIALAVGFFQTKAMAMLLGPPGIAMFGLYASALGLFSVVCDMGISHSGVRQIAEAVAKEDKVHLAKTVFVLRWAVFISGIIAVVLLLLVRKRLSLISFGSEKYADELAILSLFLFFGMITGGQSALIQGSRRINEMAQMKIICAVFAVCINVPLIWLMRENGIHWAMVVTAFTTFVVYWFYARRIKTVRIALSFPDIGKEIHGLIGLGTVFMSSGLMSTAVLYLSRVLIVRHLGIDAAGLYQASAGLSMIYVGMVLDAMGMDFYPRLTGVADNNVACNRMVNEQTKISLLLAIPGVLITLTIAPLLLKLFYSGEFVSASGILYWQILGVVGRVVSWPLGYIMLAKGAGRYYFTTELTANLLHIIFLFFAIRLWGIVGAGVAFFALYLVYFLVVITVANHLSGFVLSRENIVVWLQLLPAIVIVFLLMMNSTGMVTSILCGVISVTVAGWCFWQIYVLIGKPPVAEIYFSLKKGVQPAKKVG